MESRKGGAKAKNVDEYLRDLEEAKKEKPEQVKEALELYIDLWRKTIEKGIIEDTDEIDVALSKIDKEGGLYKAAE
ncbi:MAG: hypothetical protein OK422_00630 [Thaumarchaeota archaeon]|nr:hypothetical protein [Nitrososphaerota archaeon]